MKMFDMMFNAKSLSELQILRLVYRKSSLTRNEISEVTGWNQTKVVRLVADLLERNLLRSAENQVGKNRLGRPSELLEINPAAGNAVGLEFGRNRLRCVITDAVGKVVFSLEEESPPPFEGSEKTIRQLTAFIQKTVADGEATWDNVYAVGIALHDIVNSKGQWVTHENINLPPYDVKQRVMNILDRSVVVEDISRAFAEAEHRFGAGVGSPDMIYVFLGSHGVGSGIFIDNEMLKSSTGVCGEIGHVVVDEGGELCSCGNHGCFEAAASRDMVVKQVEELVSQGIQTSFRRNEPISFEEICKEASLGDKVAYLVLHRLAQRMSKALAPTVNITGAPHIIVGGELALAGETFLSALTGELRQKVIGILARNIEVRAATLPKYAGAWGAAVQALEAAWLEGRFLNGPSPSQKSAVPE